MKSILQSVFCLPINLAMDEMFEVKWITAGFLLVILPLILPLIRILLEKNRNFADKYIFIKLWLSYFFEGILQRLESYGGNLQMVSNSAKA